MSLVNSSSAALQGLRHHAPVQAPMQAYVIEVGDTQAGLVSRAPEERFFTFISASSAFHRLEGHRFATPLAAEQAARLLAASQRGKRYQLGGRHDHSTQARRVQRGRAAGSAA